MKKNFLKQLTSVLFMVLIVICCVSLAGCKDKDDDPEEPGVEGTTDGEGGEDDGTTDGDGDGTGTDGDDNQPSTEYRQLTCTQAAEEALALASGKEGTEIVVVTGYVTSTDRIVSEKNAPKMQQCLYVGDVKGSNAQTLYIYWGTLVTERGTNPITVGAKITLTGKLMNYGGTTAEMANPDIVVVEEGDAVPEITDGGVKTCAEAKALGDAMDLKNPGTVKYHITGFVTSTVNNNEVKDNKETFWIADEEPTDEDAAKSVKVLQVYKGTLEAKRNGKPVTFGAKVTVVGFLEKYNNSTDGDFVEVVNGDIEVLTEGKTLQDIPDAGNKGDYSNPYTVDEALALFSGSSEATSAKTGMIKLAQGYVEGYIVGQLANTSYSEGSIEQVAPFTADQTNILIATSASETDKTKGAKMLLVKIKKDTAPYTSLNLGLNNSNVGKKVRVYGVLTKGYGTAIICNTTQSSGAYKNGIDYAVLDPDGTATEIGTKPQQ